MSKEGYVTVPGAVLTTGFYTIPSGYKAEIKDGKVIVKEKESEDEEIRTLLVALVQWAKSFNQSGLDPNTVNKIFAYLEKQKEQKPVSQEDMPYVTDEHFFERESADSFKYRLAEYMTKNCTKKESPYGFTYSINSETILEMAKEELIKRGELQKPVEIVNYPSDVIETCMLRYLQSAANRKDDVEIVEDTKAFKKELLDIIKQIEKPVEWSEEQQQLFDEILVCLLADGHEREANILKTLFEQAKGLSKEDVDNAVESFNSQRKQEWSEEDEQRYISIRTALEVSAILEKEEYDANVEWLRDFVNSVKYRSPQPRQEWNEEEKEELTEFEKAVSLAFTDAQLIPRDKDGVANIHDINEFVRKKAVELLDLAKMELGRKGEIITLGNLSPYDKGFQDGKAEARKDLPKWKKTKPERGNAFGAGPWYSGIAQNEGKHTVFINEYEISVDELFEKLEKE